MLNLEGSDKNVIIYSANNFPHQNVVGRVTNGYNECVCSFDIESTSVYDDSIIGEPFGFMYVWQFGIIDCSGNYWAIMGREWRDFSVLLRKLSETLEGVIVIYVHNLSFEFQFMRNFIKFTRVFAKDEREVIQCEAFNGKVQFRCSYALTNMGLAKATQKTIGVTWTKQDGEDFDYRIARYPDTLLNYKEILYCICDVWGLCEVIKGTLKQNNDTIASVPMTSTGFVRRDYYNASVGDGETRKWVSKKIMTPYDYEACKKASRGAISGSNYINTDEILRDVDSWDIKSSYPYVMLTCYFPFSKFRKLNVSACDTDFYELLENYCCILTFKVESLKLKEWSCIPYISYAKCDKCTSSICGNGKVYMAKETVITCTEIDFRIIKAKYKLDGLEILEFRFAERGKLPYSFRNHLAEMFQVKTELEDGDKYEYNKYKNKINASFGMMLTDIVFSDTIYNGCVNKPWDTETNRDVAKALARYYSNKKSFLCYQDGVWVLAHARRRLVEGMDIVGEDIVQVDTDSVKTLGDYRDSFYKLNNSVVTSAGDYDVKPYSIKNGKRVYLGVWEHEQRDDVPEYLPTYKEFKSLGAKKYAYVENGDPDEVLHITVSGLNKGAGNWLSKQGGIKMFKNGMYFPARDDNTDEIVSGRTASYYSDRVSVETVTVDGHRVTVGSSVCITDVGYTLGMTQEWLNLILDGKVDAYEEMHCNEGYGV